MSQVVIELLRTAPYLRDAKVIIGADMDDTNVDPKTLKTEAFNGKSTGTARVAINYSLDAGGYVWDHEYLPEEEFKKLVPKCAIANDLGQTIKSFDDINFFNRDESFFCNDDMTVILVKGRVVLDDAVPRNKVICAFFFADTARFVRVDGDEIPDFSDETYSIGLVEHVEKARDQAATSELNIGAKLLGMGRPQLLVLAKLWDIHAKNSSSDDIIRARIFDMIKKSPITLGPKSRAAWFSRYISLSQEKIKLYDTFMDGRRTRLVVMNDDDMYTFNGVVLGKTEDDSVAFLDMAMNESLLKALKEGIRYRANKLEDDLGAYEVEKKGKKKLVESETDGEQSPNT